MVMTSASSNSQFLVSSRSNDIAICPMVVGDDGLYRNLQDFKKNGNEQSVSEKSLTRVWCVNTASASRNSDPC